MDHLEATAVVHAAPVDVYAFLLDVPRYAGFAEHLRSIERRGDGAPGTDYALTFAWWTLAHTVTVRVTDVEPPRRIDWRVVDDLEARGHWLVDPAGDGPDDAATASSRVRLHVAVGPDAADPDVLDLPRFVPLDRVVDRARAAVRAEAERVLRGSVAALEGRSRPVDLHVETWTDDG